MSKYDLTEVLSDIQSSYKKDERRANQFGLGDSLPSVSHNPEDYVVMPEWYQRNYGVLGLRYGHMVEVAGDSDTGKTSFCILAMKQAQQQDVIVVYAETEGKTSEEDLVVEGLNPKGVMTIHSKIIEEVYEGINRTLDSIKNRFPDAKILLLLDSFGNNTSMRDAELDMTSKVAMVGGKAKSNRLGLGAIAARQIEQDIAMVIINYTYDNIGSVGKTSAGGKALNFYTMLRIQTQRTGWYERTIAGEKVRAGAHVRWRVQKNHYAKALKDAEGNGILLPKQVDLRISAAGFEVL